MDLQDKIGREAFVDKIIGFVDSLKKGKNFCLAINGAWGSGKSFVLGLIEEKLSQKQEYIINKIRCLGKYILFRSPYCYFKLYSRWFGR